MFLNFRKVPFICLIKFVSCAKKTKSVKLFLYH